MRLWTSLLVLLQTTAYFGVTAVAANFSPCPEDNVLPVPEQGE